MRGCHAAPSQNHQPVRSIPARLFDDRNSAVDIDRGHALKHAVLPLSDGPELVGELVLKFTDNSLTTSGNADNDLWIFESGEDEG